MSTAPKTTIDQAIDMIERQNLTHWSDAHDRVTLNALRDYRSTWSEDGQAWVELTDADRQRAFESLPDMLDGFLKKWGWLHFAKAIEAICKEKNAKAPEGEQP